MTAPVQARYQWTADEVGKALTIHCRHNSWLHQLVRWLGVAMIVAMLATSLHGFRAFVGGLPLGLLGLYFYLLVPLSRLQVRRRFRENPNRDASITWTFGENDLGSSGEGFNQNQTWMKVYEFLDSPSGFLIYPQKNLYYWIPLTAFASNADIEAVRDVARRRVKSYKKVG